MNAPDTTRLTRFEKRVWGPVVLQQFHSTRSTYQKNLKRYGDLGAVFISVANLWIGFSFPFVAAVFVAGALSVPEVEVVTACLGFLMLAMGAWRLTQGVQEGKRFRQGHEDVEQEPEKTEAQPPPTGWAVQTRSSRSKRHP